MNRMTDAAIDAARQCAANNALLDFVAMQTCSRTDAILAATLDASPPTLSKIRHGHIPIGVTMQLAMLEHCNITLAQLRQYVPSPLRSKRKLP